MRRVWTLVCLWLMGVPHALSYEPVTHADMSRVAVQSSVLNQPSLGVLTDLGLQESISVADQFPDSSNAGSSMTEVLRF